MFLVQTYHTLWNNVANDSNDDEEKKEEVVLGNTEVVVVPCDATKIVGADEEEASMKPSMRLVDIPPKAANVIFTTAAPRSQVHISGVLLSSCFILVFMLLWSHVCLLLLVLLRIVM